MTQVAAKALVSEPHACKHPKYFPFSREGLGWLGRLPLAWFSCDASVAPAASVALLTDDFHFY